MRSANPERDLIVAYLRRWAANVMTVEAQVKLRGLDPETAVKVLEDAADHIARGGHETWLYTSQPHSRGQ